MKEFVTTLIKEAGSLLLIKYGPGVAASRKGEMDLVTEADLASQRLIVEAIRERYPHHAILAEEGLEVEGTEFIWLIDPLDGTINYFHGYPVFAPSIAVQRGQETILGAIYDPLRDELFYAQRGGGATLNGHRLTVSSTRSLASALLATGFPYERATLPNNNLAEFNHLIFRAQEIRRGGAATLDLAYVAAGRLDGYWEMHLNPWDWAAGALLVEEAGGRVTDLEGKPWKPSHEGLVATNGLFHEELIRELARARGSYGV